MSTTNTNLAAVTVFLGLLLTACSPVTPELGVAVVEEPVASPTDNLHPTIPPIPTASLRVTLTEEQTQAQELEQVVTSTAQCDERTLYQHSPVDLAAIEFITPMGLMYDSHVTPVDHAYFQNFKEPDREIDVFSPAAGTVTGIQRMVASVSDEGDIAVDDYRIVIDHACSISSIFIHVDKLSPSLAAAAPPLGDYASVQVPVEAGELIGSFTANVDYNLVDYNITLEKLLVPSTYESEPWKIHTPDYFDYYTPEIQEGFVAKSLRTIEPIAGQIAYDIDGRLVGNWFHKGTEGYRGVDRGRNWAGHLSIAYDHLDPRAVFVSIGTFDGRSTQATVAGNRPDPADVTIDSGLVLYELVSYDYYVDGQHWDRTSLVKGLSLVPASESDGVVGVIAVQLVGERELLVETFPGLTLAEVEGFSDAVLTYVR